MLLAPRDQHSSGLTRTALGLRPYHPRLSMPEMLLANSVSGGSYMSAASEGWATLCFACEATTGVE